ncbi:acyl-CoA dehydrogenase family protein [Roseomonas marmotae]|uniref:Acyl-CoA/acyl-ACP dehydrogenase n=1 Tax=Roseomonas marmotae TaxID=2768161 RepID=A0ABS3KBV0_9PROT|nr:acyl-CoA dehydrogenase family protein [Roseomonas marmotae]MBO1073821.1 acyl-CoA/acyl-ACP dehydrogenase [Roseomonas marmotae]QTI78549.1 acyl-CoA/acyl-ACP dehydrogenase [Roseomonas marmotae]
MPFTATPLLPGDLLDSARKFAIAADARTAELAGVRERDAHVAQLWQQATELGWPAIAVPEDQGGVGGGLADLAALVEGAAGAALPLPLIPACAVAPALLEAAGEAGHESLTGIAEGSLRVVPVLSEDAPGLRAVREGDSWRLSGQISGAPRLPGLTHLLVACAAENGTALLLLPADAPGLMLRQHERLDGQPSLDATCEGAPATLLAQGEAVDAALARARDAAAFLISVEAVAAMGAALEQTIGYLNTRVQFAQPLSAFQALRHRTVDLYVQMETARALVRHLLEQVEAGTPWSGREVSLSKLQIGLIARAFAKEAIHLHGGMGMTEELGAVRLAKRLLLVEFEYGDSAARAEALLAA